MVLRSPIQPSTSENRLESPISENIFAGRGLKVRTRLYLVSPQQQTSAECNEQLMEKSECEGTARPDCEFSAEDARLICGMKKEVCLHSFYAVIIGCCDSAVVVTNR